MCGICGWAGEGRFGESSLRAMAASLSHRGPDAEGFLLADGVGLGHRRLSIIDLEGGRQPIPNEDGSPWLVLNGEIYNHRALRRELLAKGHRFRTGSDAEVVLHLYEDRQGECVHFLRGMFAFAIWAPGDRRPRAGARGLAGARRKCTAFPARPFSRPLSSRRTSSSTARTRRRPSASCSSTTPISLSVLESDPAPGREGAGAIPAPRRISRDSTPAGAEHATARPRGDYASGC